MKYKWFCVFFIWFLSLSSFASPNDNNSLRRVREEVVRSYITALQNADYNTITSLFEDNGIVISTSRGKVDARDFFASFFPQIESAATEIHGIYFESSHANRYLVRFHFTFYLKDGEIGEGEYVDEFVFSLVGSKLVAVYMFENLKFDPVHTH